MNLARYHARLRLLPCVVCIALGLGATKMVELHHTGMPDQRNDWLVIPLCDCHHQGAQGIHTLRRRIFAKDSRLSDHALLGITFRLFVADLP